MTSLAALAFARALERDQQGVRSELRARGVVATPIELACYAIARVDELLRRELSIAEGLASERVVVVDPAVGTGIWLASVLECTRTAGVRTTSGERTMIGIDVADDTLASTESLLRAEALEQGVRLELRCANTLELARVLSVEDERVLVILGNPPWAARSLSRGGLLSDAWLSEFRRDHAGAPLDERRVGVLSDDYVRFFRWALEQARTTRAGALLCLATNASFLDGPVHRGMRAALVGAFDRLELLDLGGNALLSARMSGDENLFGVRVGAALTWAVRRRHGSARTARVAVGSLLGKRNDKLAALAGDSVRLTEIAPCAPWFRFRRALSPGIESAGFSLAEAFAFQREGVQTNRDALCIAPTREALEAQLWAFVRGERSPSRSRHFDPDAVRPLVAGALEQAALPVVPLAYRPLDGRLLATLAPLCHRPRKELQRAAAHSELCLLAVRKERGGAPFNLFAPALHVADACFLSVRSSCRTRVFPSRDPEGRENVSESVAEELARRVGRAVSGRELVLYALSQLGSPRFRTLHEEQLKLDYPRLPWPADAEQLERALVVGERFVAALCGSSLSGGARAPFVVHAAEAEPLSSARLVYDDATRSLAQHGRRLVSELEPSCWSAHVGHHALVFSALRCQPAPRVAELMAALARAAAWAHAEQVADALLADSPAAEGAAR